MRHPSLVSSRQSRAPGHRFGYRARAESDPALVVEFTLDFQFDSTLLHFATRISLQQQRTRNSSHPHFLMWTDVAMPPTLISVLLPHLITRGLATPTASIVAARGALSPGISSPGLGIRRLGTHHACASCAP